jgi:hypothetical protein
MKLVIGVVVLSIVMVGGRWVWLRSAAAATRPHVPAVAGVLVLRPPRRTGLMLGSMGVLPAALLGAMAFRAWASGVGRSGLATVAAAALLMAALSAHQLVAAFRQHVVVSEWGIEQVGVVLRRQVRWAQIASVAYNPLHHWFYFVTAERSRFWISEELNGIGDFAMVALKRLPREALAHDPFAREQLEDLSAQARAAAAGDASGAHGP